MSEQEICASLRSIFQSITDRFEHDEKILGNFVGDVVKALAHRDSLIAELQQYVVQLRKEVADLQNAGVDKVLLQESRQSGPTA